MIESLNYYGRNFILKDRSKGIDYFMIDEYVNKILEKAEKRHETNLEKMRVNLDGIFSLEMKKQKTRVKTLEKALEQLAGQVSKIERRHVEERGRSKKVESIL